MAELGQQKPLSHLDFRIAIYTFLFGFHTQAKIHRLQLGLGGRRLFNSHLDYIHIRVKRGDSNCAWCGYIIRYNKVIGLEAKGGKAH